MRFWLAALMMLVLALPTRAEDVPSDVLGDLSPGELKAHLQGWGYQVFAHEDEQDRPQLLVSRASGEGKGFAIRLIDCTPEDVPEGVTFMQKRCAGFEFRAYIKPGFPIKEKVYADWNREFGHTRAFVKEDVPRLAWRISVLGGVTWANIRASVDIWGDELTAYIDHLDASVMD